MHTFDPAKHPRDHGKFSHTQGAAGVVGVVAQALAGAAPGKAGKRGAPEYDDDGNAR